MTHAHKRALEWQINPPREHSCSVGWPSDEILAINVARIAGQSDDQIRELVTRLHAKRSELLSGV